MIYKFRIISGEADDFLREIAISGDKTFLEFHHVIQTNLNYDESHLASFFITDTEWHKEKEITLLDMSVDSSEEIFVMESSIIEDNIQSNKQRLLYVFDLFNERALFIEVYSIDEGSSSDPILLNSKGNAPVQLVDDFQMDDLNDDFDEMDSYFEAEEGFDEESDFENLSYFEPDDNY